MFYFIYFMKNIRCFTGCSSFLIISTILFSSHISNFSFLLSSYRSPSLSLCSLLNFYFTHFSISIFVISQFLFSFVLNFYYLFLISTVPLFSILFPFYSQFFSPSLLNFVTLVSLQYVTDVDSEVSKRAIASIGLIARRVSTVSAEMTQQ